MEITEYEQNLIKCQYMLAVCDSLLRGLQIYSISNKLKKHIKTSEQDSDEEFNTITVERKYNSDTLDDKRQYQKTNQKLQIEIKQAMNIIKDLKQQILSFDTHKIQNVKKSRFFNKKDRQYKQSEQQLNHLKKLLNIELQNINSFESNSIDINYRCNVLDKKQMQIQQKINTLVQKQKEYCYCRQLDKKYQELIDKKRNVIQERKGSDMAIHSSIQKKVFAIGQSNQNLTQMKMYEKHLQKLIKQQQFIIQEISQRQTKQTTKDKYLQTLEVDQVFEQQISHLRKTIANRKFKKRTQNIKPNKRKQPQSEQPTEVEKNIKKPIQSQIFKIQIQPICHTKPTKPNKFQHRHSEPNVQTNSQLNIQKMSNKLSQFVKNQQKPLDFDTIQIETLKKIIQKKESQYTQALKLSLLVQDNDKKQLKSKKSQKIQKKKRVKTQIYPRESQQETKTLSNSRYIQKIISKSSPQSMKRFNNNVRIRTKKSEEDRLKMLQLMKNSQKIKRQKLSRSKFFSQNNTKSNQLPELKIKNSFSIASQNQIEYQTQRLKNKFKNQFLQYNQIPSPQSTKNHKSLKYKSKFQGNEQVSTQNVKSLMKKIKQIQTKQITAFLQQSDKEKKPKSSQKIKIYKLPANRKNRSYSSMPRKGKAEVLEISDSDKQEYIPQANLSKIEEQDQSIRDTKQSITYR